MDTDRISFIPFSLLNDIPVKNNPFLNNVHQIIEKAEQCISISDTINCLNCLESIWNKIDGKHTVQDIADIVSAEESADMMIPVVFLLILLAEDHQVVSAVG